MSRAALRSLVATMLLVLVLAFVFVLLRSLSGGYDSAAADQFSDIGIGATEMRRVDGQRVWVSRISSRQRDQLQNRKLRPDTNSAACDSNTEFCLLGAATLRDGIEIRYIKQRPAALSRDVLWEGGFIDPTNGYVFDLFGRSYGAYESLEKWPKQ